jgi:hypothetical protein
MSIQAPALFSAEETARMQCVCIIVSNAIPTGGDSQSIDDWFAHVEALMVQPVIPTRALHHTHSSHHARIDVCHDLYMNLIKGEDYSLINFRVVDAVMAALYNA